MQKIIYKSEIRNYTEQLEAAVINYIEEGLIETYEDFEKFSIIAFDWYDIYDVEADPAQLMLYLDKEDFIVICENEAAFEAAKKYFVKDDSNERSMYLFFKNLFRGDMKKIEDVEDVISEMDDAIFHGKDEDMMEKIVDVRYEVLRLKKYYEQFDIIFDELCDNDNEMLSEHYVDYFGNLRNRAIRFNASVMNLREYIMQVRESYQAQIDLEQNRLMKVFTLVTSIFLPLTLIAGWYGMNLRMPEYEWAYGYPIIIAVCALVCIVWFIIFKKKGWFK